MSQIHGGPKTIAKKNESTFYSRKLIKALTFSLNLINYVEPMQSSIATIRLAGQARNACGPEHRRRVSLFSFFSESFSIKRLIRSVIKCVSIFIFFKVILNIAHRY